MAEFDLTLHDKKHFLRMVTLAIKDIFGIELHGFENRKEGPEKIGVLV
jgi:hypothetical protein